LLENTGDFVILPSSVRDRAEYNPSPLGDGAAKLPRQLLSRPYLRYCLTCVHRRDSALDALHRRLLMSQVTRPQDSELQSLARKTNTPLEQVEEVYAAERAALERSARIKTFIGVLATGRTRSALSARARRRS